MATAVKIDDVKSYLAGEIKEYEEALAFVLLEMDGANKVQYSRTFQRKKAEYEGALLALNDALEFLG